MGRVVRGRGGEQLWDRTQAPLEEGEGGALLWDRPQALPGEGWRVGGQPWDGPLALPGKGGVSGAGAGGGLAWGKGGAGPAFSPALFLLGGGVGAAKGLLSCFLLDRGGGGLVDSHGNTPTGVHAGAWHEDPASAVMGEYWRAGLLYPS